MWRISRSKNQISCLLYKEQQMGQTALLRHVWLCGHVIHIFRASSRKKTERLEPSQMSIYRSVCLTKQKI